MQMTATDQKCQSFTLIVWIRESCTKVNQPAQIGIEAISEGGYPKVMGRSQGRQ